MSISKKIGFWSVFSIVTGSQIGTTIFISPAGLAPYGIFGLMGWLISGIGAIALCFVFSSLCSHFPQTGGPHAYINHVFGPTAAFFAGWTYWVISWVSTTVVVVTAIGTLSPFLGDTHPIIDLALQIILLLTIMLLNLKGVRTAGKVEFILILIKLVPLIILPLFALFHFNIKNFSVTPEVHALPLASILGRVTLLTFFGFIGLECATTPAGAIQNPSKTIPKAIIVGTLCVALLYLLNSIGIMGILPGSELAYSKAPYVDASKMVFGGNWYLLISFLTFIICIGTLNAWVLSSGQVLLGLAQDGLLPKKLSKQNERGAPIYGVVLSCLGMVPFLVLTSNKNLSSQVNEIIDFSVTAFLFVYLSCSLAFLKLKFQENTLSFLHMLYGGFSILFCSWVIYKTPISTLLIATLFILSGVPMYFFWYRKKPHWILAQNRKSH